MFGTEAARLFVSVNADTDKAEKGLSALNTHADKGAGFLKTMTAGALGFGGALVGVAVAGKVFSTITGGAIGMNAQLETSTLQFTTLMGDSDKAAAHVKGLFDFAAKTPFETGPIIEASRLMETFGGSALDSTKNLTTFGDAAAATGQPINEVAFWMSRAYAAIQAGKPWGEAAQRLGEMGIVTPKTRQALEDMQASGAKGPAVWEALTGSLGKFDGAMVAQSQTFDGMLSTFTDGMNMFLAKALYPLFEGLKGLLGWLNEVMASPGFNGALESAMAAVGAVFEWVTTAFRVGMEVLGPIIQAFGSLFGLFQSGEGVTASFSDILNGLVGKILGFLQTAIDWVLTTGVPMAADALGKFAVAFIDWIGPTAGKVAAALPGIVQKVISFLAANLPVIVGKLVEWGGAFIGWVAKNVLPRLPGVLATVLSALVGFIAGAVPVVVAGMIDLGRRMVAGAMQFLAQLPQTVGKTLSQVIAGIPGAAAQLAAAAVNMGGKFVSGFINGLISLPGKIAGAIRNAFANIHIDIGPFHISGSGVSIDLPHISLPGFATGLWNVPQNMPAFIHAGEMVVPRDIADRLRGGGGFGGGGGGSTSGGGGGDVFIFDIGEFHGTEDNIQRLSESVATAVRLSRPKRTVYN